MLNPVFHIRRWLMNTLKPFGEAPPDALRLSLGDRNPDVARALASTFGDVPAVEVVEGNLLDVACDAIVSPANSFGDMGGGIDKAIDDLSQGAAQRRVRDAIASQCMGELPVGMALLVEISGCRIPYVVAAPTMRVPGNVAGSINAYLSMRAALVCVVRHNLSDRRPIRHLAVPGLGTGVGGMAYAEVAQQMRTAYEVVIGGRWREIVHPAMAPNAMAESRAVRK